MKKIKRNNKFYELNETTVNTTEGIIDIDYFEIKVIRAFIILYIILNIVLIYLLTNKYENFVVNGMILLFLIISIIVFFYTIPELE